jgi:hypothetical protein
MVALRSFITDGGITVTCPKKPRDTVYAQWFEGGQPTELIRYLSEITERLVDEVDLPEGPALVDNVQTEPGYMAADTDLGRDFLNHLGEAALAMDEGVAHLGVLTRICNWASASDQVVVEANVSCREGPGGEWFEPAEDEEFLRAFLPLTTQPAEVHATCAQYPTALIDRGRFGVAAYWIGKLGGSAAELNFDIGPAFVESLNSMNYQRNHRYASSCLRIMGLIAAGRDGEIEGHEERDGAGPGNSILEDCDGNPVMRAYLAKKSPDANRLFWVRGARPRFLNVTGHEGRPAL